MDVLWKNIFNNNPLTIKYLQYKLNTIQVLIQMVGILKLYCVFIPQKQREVPFLIIRTNQNKQHLLHQPQHNNTA